MAETKEFNFLIERRKKMYQKRALILPLVLMMTLSACATANGDNKHLISSMTTTSGKEIPKPSAGFHAADVLAYSSKAVFKAAIDVLDDTNVPIITQSKEDGRIITDYVAGPRSTTAFGILGTNSSRYKYLILVKDSGRGSKLKVTAFLESSSDELQSWRDVSQDNDEAVQNIQNALIEKVENRLSGK